MRIGIDTISAGSGGAVGAGGMSTYYRGLLGALAEASDGEDELVVFVPPRPTGTELPSAPNVELVRCEGLPDNRIGRVAYEQIQLARLARRHAVDVLLSTVNVKPAGWRGPSVVVLQSMQSFFIPDRIGALRKAYIKAAVPASLRRADRVIAVSETARTDAIGLFDLDPTRVVTVHHGCSPWAIEASESFERSGMPPVPPPLDATPYVLNVSALYGLKNQPRLIRAFAQAMGRSRLPHRLVIAGREADLTRADLEAVARECGIESRVSVLGEYPQEHLPALYANADLVAYPSLYETFGHPVLEAFAFGKPLLTSGVGGSSEVAADAAIKVEPRSVNAMAGGLELLLTNPQLRERLTQAGRERLRSFSWVGCARGTRGALRDAVAARPKAMRSARE